MTHDDRRASRPSYSHHVGEPHAHHPAEHAQPSSPEQRYAQRRLLGIGQRGRVEEAFDVVLQRSVALKILKLPSASALTQFRREQAITAELDHPGIVTIHDAGMLSDGRPYYTMRLIRGRSLASALEHRSARDYAALLASLIQLCDAVGFAHDRGIVHRDLKPANMMLGDFGEAIVVDWGLATHTGAAARSGAPVGTPLYMSPEQARAEAPEVAADVWSLGQILFEVVSGRAALEASGSEAVMTTLEALPVSWRPPIPPTVPLELGAIIEQALAVEPSRRYSSGRALADDLRAFLDGRRVAAFQYSRGALLRRALRAWKIPLLLALGVTALLVALAASAYVRVVEERDRASVAEATAQQQRGEADALAAELLAEKATEASLQHGSLESHRLARQSLGLADTIAARSVLAKTAFELRPRLLGTFEKPCVNPSISDEGTLAVCAHKRTLSLHALGEVEPLWSLPLETGVFSMYASEALGRVVVSKSNGDVAQYTLGGEEITVAQDVPRARVAQPLTTPLWVAWRSFAANVYDNGEVITEPTGCANAMQTGAWTDGVLVAFCDDATISVGGEVVTPPNPAQLDDLDDAVEAAPGQIVAINGRSLFRFDVRTHELIRVERDGSADRGFLDRVRGSWISIASDGPGMELWDTEQMTPLFRLPDDWGYEAVSLEDGTFLSIGDDAIFHWAVDDDLRSRRFVHRAGLSSAAIAPDGKTVATAGGSGALTLWSAQSGAQLWQQSWASAVLKSATFSPDGAHLLALSSGASGVRVFDASTLELAHVLTYPGHTVNGRRVLSLRDGAVIALTYAPGMMLWPDPLDDGPPTVHGTEWMIDGSASENGAHAAAVTVTGHIWTIEAGAGPPQKLTQFIDATSVDIDNTGQRVVIARVNELLVLDARGAIVQTIPNTIGVPIDLSVRGAGDLVAVSTHNGAVGVWDLDSGELRGHLQGHTRRSVSVDFRGDTLVSASWDQAAQLWALAPLLDRNPQGAVP